MMIYLPRRRSIVTLANFREKKMKNWKSAKSSPPPTLSSNSRSWIRVAHPLGYMPAEFQLDSHFTKLSCLRTAIFIAHVTLTVEVFYMSFLANLYIQHYASN